MSKCYQNITLQGQSLYKQSKKLTKSFFVVFFNLSGKKVGIINTFLANNINELKVPKAFKDLV